MEDAGDDASMASDSAGNDASFDAADSGGSDAATEASSLDAGPFDGSAWSVTAAEAGDLRGPGPGNGGAFDGRYVYFAGTTTVRFDTTGDFSADASWASFDLTSIDPNLSDTTGAVYDGRYVYIVGGPSDQVQYGVIYRYDPEAPFGVATSWTTFDVRSISAGAYGFCGAVFDGRFIEFVPFRHQTGVSGISARLDTTADFTAPAAWSTFNLATLGPDVAAYCGGVFDGRYVYYVPDIFIGDAGGVQSGLVARYDTTSAFGSSASWATFDTTSVNPNAAFFRTGAFDGRFAYFLPSGNSDAPLGTTVARLDTQGTFTDAAAWSTFDTTSVSPNSSGFGGSAYDGRFLYFTGQSNPPATDGPVFTLDTQAPFSSLSSWNALDTATDGLGANFGSAVFDGQFVYFASRPAVRFHAHSPEALPAGYTGSFF
jgi:hypothetical protein